MAKFFSWFGFLHQTIFPQLIYRISPEIYNTGVTKEFKVFVQNNDYYKEGADKSDSFGQTWN